MPYDSDFKLTPGDLIDPAATEQDEYDEDIAEWYGATSEWDQIDAADGIPRPTDDDDERNPGSTSEQL